MQTGQGRDRDFYGHGPQIRIDVDAFSSFDPDSPVEAVTPDPNSIEITVDFDADETQSNWSAAQHNVAHQLATVPRCWHASRIVSAANSFHQYWDTDHQLDPFTISSGPARMLEIKGDTSNDDIGRCTADDSSYTVHFNPVTVEREYSMVPACLKADGTLPDQVVIPASLLAPAFTAIENGVSMVFDNADLSQGEPRFRPNNSFIAYIADTDWFSVQPFTTPADGRYTYFISDVHSVGVTVAPEAGGWLVMVDFETAGEEIRSRCDRRIQRPSGEYLDPVTLTIAEVQAEIQAGGVWAQCELGNEVKVDLNRIRAGFRLYPGVENGAIRFRPAHPKAPWRDVFVDLSVYAQSGPCHENVMSASDDCMDLDELDLVLEQALQATLGDVLMTGINAGNSVFDGIFGVIEDEVQKVLPGLTPEVLSIYTNSEGDLVVLTR